MRAASQWNQTPFTRLHEYEKKLLPYVCAIVPFEYGFRFEWFDKGSSGSHKVVVHKLESYDAPMEFEVNDSICEIKDLQKDCDYEFTLYRSDMTAKSATRLVRTGFIRGNVINYLHPKDGFYAHSGKYLGSPSIVRLPSGKLFCIMDIHSGGEGENIAILFTSDDDAKSWRYVTELSPCFWPKLFYHREKLYVLACAGVYGDIRITACDAALQDTVGFVDLSRQTLRVGVFYITFVKVNKNRAVSAGLGFKYTACKVCFVIHGGCRNDGDLREHVGVISCLT